MCLNHVIRIEKDELVDAKFARCYNGIMHP
jgi:hypothetical protein